MIYVIPEQQKKDLILEAVEKYGDIYPCPKKHNGDDNTEGLYGGFTEFNGFAVLWFNDKEGSTHVVKGRIITLVGDIEE